MKGFFWIITKVLASDLQFEVGTMNAHRDGWLHHDEALSIGNPVAAGQRLMSMGGHKFRMKDDDGAMVYEGVFMGDVNGHSAFAPLDDFGEPNYGCTCIEYLSGGKWSVL